MRTSSSFPWILVLTGCIKFKGIAGDECKNYSDLQNLTSRHPDNVYNSNTAAISDNQGFETKWYRAGHLDMPNTMPETNRCGTAWPFYLQGKYPVPMNAEIQENRACIGDQFDPCYYYRNIQVRNCGSYRVYKLTSIEFNDSAYCFSFCANCNLPSTTRSTLMGTTTASKASTATMTTSTTTTTSLTSSTATITSGNATTTLKTSTTTTKPRSSPRSSEVCFRPLEFVVVIVSCMTLCLICPVALVIYLQRRPVFGKNKEKDRKYTEVSYISSSQNIHVYDEIVIP